MGRKSSQKRIPHRPQANGPFHFQSAVGMEEIMSTGPWGFCSVQSVIFFSTFAYSYFLTRTERTFFPNEA